MFQKYLHRVFQRTDFDKKIIRVIFKNYCTGGQSDVSKPLQTIQKLKDDLRISMGVTRTYKKEAPDRENLNTFIPKDRSELPHRTMHDSYLSATIPLEVDLDLQDKYCSFLGGVRKGRLLEDMDIFSVMVLKKYMLFPKAVPGKLVPFAIVTLSIDKIYFADNDTKIDANITISGYVSWVGNSTAEVVVWLEQKIANESIRIVQALFILNARNATNSSSTIINPLQIEEDYQKELVEGAALRNSKRTEMRKNSLNQMIPTSEEQAIMHNLFINTVSSNELDFRKRTLSSDSIWMDQCTLTTIYSCQPEDRNFHNTVFGGLILKTAYELAYALTYLFFEERPRVHSMSDITFKTPVYVNSLLKMQAHIVYSHQQFAQVIVIAESIDPGSSNFATSDKFYFTFKTRSNKVVKQIIPNTYVEAIMYIDGYRHYNNIMDKNEKIHLFNPLTKNI